MTATRARAAAGTPSQLPVPAAAQPEPTEAQMARAIIGAARFTGWKVVHWRPGRTVHGWRTPVQGDGVGWPDITLCHPAAGLLWFVELKMRGGRLSPEQQEWAADLGACGQRFVICKGRAGLTALLDEMATAPRFTAVKS